MDVKDDSQKLQKTSQPNSQRNTESKSSSMEKGSKNLNGEKDSSSSSSRLNPSNVLSVGRLQVPNSPEKLEKTSKLTEPSKEGDSSTEWPALGEVHMNKTSISNGSIPAKAAKAATAHVPADNDSAKENSKTSKPKSKKKGHKQKWSHLDVEPGKNDERKFRHKKPSNPMYNSDRRREDYQNTGYRNKSNGSQRDYPTYNSDRREDYLKTDYRNKSNGSQRDNPTSNSDRKREDSLNSGKIKFSWSDFFMDCFIDDRNKSNGSQRDYQTSNSDRKREDSLNSDDSNKSNAGLGCRNDGAYTEDRNTKSRDAGNYSEVNGYVPPPTPYLPYQGRDYWNFMETLSLQARLIKQINYYFSEENLQKDIFLKMHMNADGYVALSTIMSFPKIRGLTGDTEAVVKAVRASVALEVTEDPFHGVMVRTTNEPERWPIHNPYSQFFSGAPGRNYNAPAPGYGYPPFATRLEMNQQAVTTDEASPPQLAANAIPMPPLQTLPFQDLDPNAPVLGYGYPPFATGFEMNQQVATDSASPPQLASNPMPPLQPLHFQGGVVVGYLNPNEIHGPYYQGIDCNGTMYFKVYNTNQETCSLGVNSINNNDVEINSDSSLEHASNVETQMNEAPNGVQENGENLNAGDVLPNNGSGEESQSTESTSATKDFQEENLKENDADEVAFKLEELNIQALDSTIPENETSVKSDCELGDQDVKLTPDTQMSGNGKQDGSDEESYPSNMSQERASTNNNGLHNHEQDSYRPDIGNQGAGTSSPRMNGQAPIYPMPASIWD